MKTFLFWLRKIFPAIPMVCGIVGFYGVEKTSLLQALYATIKLYLMAYEEVPPNLWIEAARWLAPLATASGVVLVLGFLKAQLHSMRARATGHSVAVFGDAAEKEQMLAQLGKTGIDMTEGPVKAHRYILLGSERENLDFYTRHKAAFGKADVYLKCDELAALSSNDPQLHLFSPEETAARLFWKQAFLYPLSKRHGHRLDVVLIGCGKLGRELLVKGLQVNLFDPAQQICYHVFGAEEGFSSVYTELSEISDPVRFYAEPWYAHRDVVTQAHAIVVAEQEAQVALLRDLMLVLGLPPLYVLTANREAAEMAVGGAAMLFDWKAESNTLEAIVGAQEQAMRICLRYAALYEGVAETEENKAAVWARQDTFTRYSNLSSADYHEMQRAMLRCDGVTFPPEEARLEQLAELEHIRWCRYHYLNNWKRGAEGTRKDKVRRLHAALVPYAALSESEKEKDRENLRVFFSQGD